VRYNDSVAIGNAIYNMDQNVKVSPILKSLIEEVEKIAEEKDYRLKPMGSQIKNTALDGSDYDFLLLTEIGSKSPKKVLNDVEKDFSPLSAFQGNHSIIVKSNGIQVDIVPGERTKDSNLYKIPDKRMDDWIVRGQDCFIESFLEENNRKNNRLQTVTKMLKLWKDSHPNFSIPSLAIEKIVFDTLSNYKYFTITHVKGTLVCMKEFSERIKKPIKHPDHGPQLNKLNDNEKIICSKTLKRNLESIQERNQENWVNVFGDAFGVYLN